MVFVGQAKNTYAKKKGEEEERSSALRSGRKSVPYARLIYWSKKKGIKAFASNK